MTLEQEVIYYKNMVKLYKFDYLTGMKQRHDFEYDTLHIFTNQEFYLAMIDITGLHVVNREHGYEAGDTLIRQVANEIKHSKGLWESYRIGGDEFMAVYFDKPDYVINNATMEYVYSGDFESLSTMIGAVDQLVTDSKIKLDRRRS